MIDESNLLKFCCSGIYDTTKAMTQTEIIMKIIEKLNLIILNFNDLDNQLTKRVKELIITRGSAGPISEEEAYSEADIKKGLSNA